MLFDRVDHECSDFGNRVLRKLDLRTQQVTRFSGSAAAAGNVDGGPTVAQFNRKSLHRNNTNAHGSRTQLAALALLRYTAESYRLQFHSRLCTTIHGAAYVSDRAQSRDIYVSV